MPTWITDLRHLPSVDAPQGSAVAAKRARFTREVVEAATSRREAAPWRSAVRCLGRVGRRACGGRVHVGHLVTPHVVWSCPACGDQGDITVFEGTAHDLSRFVPRNKKLRVWAVDDEERERRERSVRCPCVTASVVALHEWTLDNVDEILRGEDGCVRGFAHASW